MPKHNDDPLAELAQLAQLQHLLSGGQAQQGEDARVQMHAALQWWQMQQQGQQFQQAHEQTARERADALAQHGDLIAQADRHFNAQQGQLQEEHRLMREQHASDTKMAFLQHMAGLLDPSVVQGMAAKLFPDEMAAHKAELAHKDALEAAFTAGKNKPAAVSVPPSVAMGGNTPRSQLAQLFNFVPPPERDAGQAEYHNAVGRLSPTDQALHHYLFSNLTPNLPTVSQQPKPKALDDWLVLQKLAPPTIQYDPESLALTREMMGMR